MAAADETSVLFHGDCARHPAAQVLHNAFLLANSGQSTLPDWILSMEGMSGRKYRTLINRLVATTEDARYLEVGSWLGSTASAALFDNHVSEACCIDNWSQFTEPEVIGSSEAPSREAFERHVQRAANKTTRFWLVEADFREVDFLTLGAFNIYLFDGPHQVQDQFDGIVLAQPALDSVFTLVVDDWNWPEVREGTDAALAAAGVEVIYRIEIRTNQNDAHPVDLWQHSDWHNGYLLAVCWQT